MKIKSLQEIVKDATPQDFAELAKYGLPFTDRTLTGEDLEMADLTSRTDGDESVDRSP